MRSRLLPSYCRSGKALEDLGGAIIHYFSARNVETEERMFDLDVCRDLFIDFNLPRDKRRRYMRADPWPAARMYASAHLLIGRDGDAIRLVEYEQQAWHAGASILNHRSDCNRWTVGLELVGTQSSGFTGEQYQTLAEVLTDLEIPREMIAGHDSVRWAARLQGSNKRPKYDPSGRKDGAGDNFDWQYLGYLLDEHSKARQHGTG